MTEPSDPLIGRTINDRFKITGLIARGGMGKVYRAEQAPLGRVCALKVLNPNYVGDHDPEFHKRFFLEASVASKLTHPNSVTIFDYGRTTDDVYYMAMEYLEGSTLHRAIRTAGSFGEERATHVARQICRALREAHSLGVIHRDLKPANIFLVEHGDEADFVKVLDFGLVKNVGEGKGEDLTQTGLFMGSPKYMSPEQIRGDRVDARTDVYALGVIMYEMLAGRVPFDRANSVNILMAHVNEEPPPMRDMNPALSISEGLEAIVMKCLAKDADARFASMDEVLASLKRSGASALTATISGAGSGDHAAISRAPSDPPAIAASEAGAVQSPFAVLTSTESAGGVQVVAPPRRAGSKAMLFGAIACGMVIVSAVAITALRLTAQKPAASIAAGSAPSAPATNAVDPTSATLPANAVKVRINSDPQGASVREDNVEICSATPCDITWKGADADPATQHKLVFTKPGFKADSRTVTSASGALSVALEKMAPEAHGYFPPPVGAPPQPGATSQIPANDPALKGFKNSPY